MKLEDIKLKLRNNLLKLHNVEVSARFGDPTSLCFLRSCKINVKPITASSNWINEVQSLGLTVELIAFLSVMKFTLPYESKDTIEFVSEVEEEISQIIDHEHNGEMRQRDSSFSFLLQDDFLLEESVHVKLINFSGIGRNNDFGLKESDLLSAISYAVIQWHIGDKKIPEIDWKTYEIKSGFRLLCEWLLNKFALRGSA